MHIRGARTITVVASLLLIVAACGAPAATPRLATPTAQAPATLAPSTSAPSTSAPSTASAALTIGIVRFSGTDVFSNSSAQGTAQYAQDHGWRVIDVDAQGSVDQMNSAITNFVTAGADVIYAGVFPTDALQGGLATAIAEDVPVANWGGGLGTGVKIAADIGPVMGDPIADRVVADMEGGGAMLVLGYRPGLPCQGRETSLLEAVEGTDIEITQQQITIPGQVDSALQATLGWAAAHPVGSAPKLAVWSCFDDPASGAVAALRQLGRTDVLTYGINGTAEAIALIQAGELTATVWIDGFAQGQELARLLEQAHAEGDAFEPVEIGGTTIVVDAQNVEQFLIDHPELAD